MRWTALWIFILSGASLASSAFAGGPFGSIHVGNWSGGAFTNDKTGAFTHCSAENGYENGVTVAIVQYSNGNWSLGFGNPAFRLTPGETFPIDVTFDDQQQLHLSGIAASPHAVFAMLPNNTALEQIRKAHLMVAVGKGSTYRFNLDSTEKLLSVIANCVAKIKADGMASAGDFSIVPTAPRPDAAGQPAADRTGRADFPHTPKPGLQTPANANVAETFLRGNFRVRYDDSKWLIRPEPDGTKWKFTLRGEDVQAIIIPEGFGAPTSAVKQVALDNLHKAAKQSDIVKEETRKVNGKDVLFMHVNATVNEIPITYYYYIYGDNRGAVQLIAFTTPSQQERYEPAIFDLLNGLEVIR